MGKHDVQAAASLLHRARALPVARSRNLCCEQGGQRWRRRRGENAGFYFTIRLPLDSLCRRTCAHGRTWPHHQVASVLSPLCGSRKTSAGPIPHHLAPEVGSSPPGATLTCSSRIMWLPAVIAVAGPVVLRA
ncbi:hypothetical protein P154DRAFT_28582 [Amniculicola lignicola CBS 123094]|uniref:Uncharacterized protein n=1 Tax=Amniculicola lignicola CBS 123094 TaxID=1392246 RepID=A0A6A5WAB2_9PLEO|nr:hypothetical protein P154DRAFT_28582 [Amniculicola lignicola CBS 123094]